jgi:outer membrane lipoprotein carrier protein
MRYLVLLLLSASTFAQSPPNVAAILRGIEQRYNATNTLQANFTTTFKDRGRAQLPQRGTLYLSKPHKTRWEYATPDGNFFLADGKFTYDYDKGANTVERERIRNTEDMRIPLAFLIGQLNFRADFDNIQASAQGLMTVIHLIPKKKKLAFREVVLHVAPDFVIGRAIVIGHEGSEMEYVLSGEQRNVKLADALFRLELPQGAKLIDAAQ